MLPTYGQPIVRSDPQSFPDNIKLFFGDDDNASIYYDETDLIVNPKEVGSGIFRIEGDIAIGDGNVAAAGTIRLPNASNIVFRNVANSGDIEAIQVDGSDNVIVGNTGNGNTLYRTESGFVHNFDQTVQISVGSLDLNSQGGIIDVGLAGNFWSSDRFTTVGGGEHRFERTGAATDSIGGLLVIGRSTTEDMVDGFGAGLSFEIEDATSGVKRIGELAFRRAGADNTGDFVMITRIAGVKNEAFRVTSAGLGSFDAAGDGTGLPSLFDKYDDALALRRGVSLGHREELEIMGVMERKNTGSGWFLNLQPFLYLLAGGVYQNRERFDHYYDDLNARLNAIGA